MQDLDLSYPSSYSLVVSARLEGGGTAFTFCPGSGRVMFAAVMRLVSSFPALLVLFFALWEPEPELSGLVNLALFRAVDDFEALFESIDIVRRDDGSWEQAFCDVSRSRVTSGAFIDGLPASISIDTKADKRS